MTTEESPDTIISNVQSKVRNLESNARLSSLCESISELDATSAKLVPWVKDIRAKGYVYEKNLESEADSYAQTWKTLSPQINQQIDQNSATLEQSAHIIQAQLNQILQIQAEPAAKAAQLQQLIPAADTLESQASAAESEIRNRFKAQADQINTFTEHLKHLDWLMVQTAAASFRLYPNEGVINAVPAVWDRNGNDDPKGTLFLTDQRVIFEQNQDVATKKILFITTASQHVQKVLFDVPIDKVEQAVGTSRGFMGKDDYIDLTFAAGSPVRTASMHLDGQKGVDWQAMIGKVKSNDYEADRAVPRNQAVQQQVQNIPTVCPKCGGKLDQPLRGQSSITCGYCGNVIRI